MSQEQIQARMQQQASKARDKIVELSKLLEKEKNEKMDCNGNLMILRMKKRNWMTKLKNLAKHIH